MTPGFILLVLGGLFYWLIANASDLGIKAFLGVFWAIPILWMLGELAWRVCRLVFT
ncbi:MAG: hypothetical protein ABI574_08885 [Burkholderiales bacterium]